MALSPQELYIDFYYQEIKALITVQYESDARNFRVHFSDHGIPISLDSNRYDLKIAMQKPDGKAVLKSCEIDSDGTGLLSFDENMCIAQGLAKAQFILRDKSDESWFRTMAFQIKIAPAVFDNDTIISTPEFEVLRNLILDVEAELKKTTEFREMMEMTLTEWRSAEMNRCTNENIRIENEEQRRQEESKRQTQEIQRQSQETQRQTQETRRQTQETQRQTQETQRQTQETQRQKEHVDAIAAADTAAKNANEAAEDLQDKLDNEHFVLTDDKGKANGVAGLDNNAKISLSHLYTATTQSPGIVQLTDSTTSDSAATAATAKSVKTVNDAIHELKNIKVDKQDGKGLSENDYTTAEKNKLSGIQTGAQINTITGVKGNAESSYRTGAVNLTPENIGAAEAVHGRHIPSFCEGISDWNNATQTGWYMASNALNAPAGGWYFGQIIAHNVNYVIQTVYQFTASTDAKLIPKYIRAKVNGVWGAWTNVTVAKAVPANAVFTDTNTWRPVQNNLTSTSATDCLSAYQGKVLKELIDRQSGGADGKYLPLTGGTLTGNLYINKDIIVEDGTKIYNPTFISGGISFESNIYRTEEEENDGNIYVKEEEHTDIHIGEIKDSTNKELGNSNVFIHGDLFLNDSMVNNIFEYKSTMDYSDSYNISRNAGFPAADIPTKNYYYIKFDNGLMILGMNIMLYALDAEKPIYFPVSFINNRYTVNITTQGKIEKFNLLAIQHDNYIALNSTSFFNYNESGNFHSVVCIGRWK